MIAYSLCTAYECGVAALISMPTHLVLDAAGGLVLATSPWLFGFADRVWVPHLVIGLVEIGTAALTRTVPGRAPAAPVAGARGRLGP